MKVEYINPFVNAAYGVLEQVLGHAPTKGSLSMHTEHLTNQQCNVIYGVTGAIQGWIVYGMSMTTADKIASAMLGEPVITFNQLAASAISELGNMISGNAMANLSSMDYTCDITPPTIIRGKNVKISSTNLPVLILPLCVKQGQIEMALSLISAK